MSLTFYLLHENDHKKMNKENLHKHVSGIAKHSFLQFEI